MSPTDTLGDIKGLPSGATVEPIVATNGTIRGLPAGAVVEPISKAAAPSDPSRAAKPFSAADEQKYTRPVAGLPAGATVHPVEQRPMAEIGPWTPTLAQKTRLWFLNTDTGKTVANSFNDIHQLASNMWTRLQEPFGGDPQQFEDLKKKQNDFIDTHIPKKIAGSEKVGSIARGAAKGSLEFGEQMTSPVQIGLMVGTFGENVLAQAAYKSGLPKLVPVARTLGKLIQAEFISQMAEGAYTNVRDAIKGYTSGNWEQATEQAVNGLASLVMAKVGIDHVDAVERVQSDLDKTSTEVFNQKFDKLPPESQGIVIDKTIENSPEYKAMIGDIDAKNEAEREKIKSRRQMQLAHYSAHAFGEAWNPDAAHRTVENLHAERAETARQEQVQKVLDTIKANVKKRTDEIKVATDEGREERKIVAAEDRERVQQTAAEIAEGREETFANRQAIGEVPTEEQTSRQVEADVTDGHVTYPAQFWGEINHFGVGTDGERHSVYRQTPRGVEWLDRTGNFTESPDSLYFNADPEVSDTVARLSSLKLAADGVAAQPEATAEEVKDAADLGEVRRQLVDGEINASEAQKRAGIAEKVRLPDVNMAAREGRLNGPFSERSATDYAGEVEKQLRDEGASEEEVAATLESLPELARVQIESNLHHVYQPGDYIISKRGVKWTLDAKRILHSSDGETAPLMKRGTYSNQAMQLAASGRVGYGTKTRLERRADFARTRDIKRQIAIRQEEFDREMRIAQQQAGLEEATITGERADEAEKAERRQKFLGRPPVPEATRKERQERRAAYKASSDPDNIINQLAKQFGTTPDEVMRVGLSESQPNTPLGKAASLEIGDKVSDPFKPDRPWIVEEKNGELQLRSGQANPIAFDRLNPSPRVLQILERGDITHDRDWTDDEKEKVALEKPYLVHQRLLADAVRDQEGKPTPEPKTQKQADEAVVQAEARKDATASIAVADAVEALNPRANVTEEEINKNVEKAAQSRKLVKVAVSQKAKAEGKAAPKGDFQAYAPMPKEGSGEAVVITQGEESHPAHYYLVKLRGVITSHFWNGNKIEIEPRYAPKAMQKRIFDDAKTEEVFSEASPERFRLADFLQAYNGPERGTPILEDGGRAIGGNTRLLRLKKWLENVRRQGGDSADAGIALFRDRMRTFARSVGIKDVPIDDEDYVVVRILDNPIRTNEDAVKLGSLFNDPTSSQVDEAVEAVTNATYLKEANARETAEGKPGILTEIGRAIAGDSVSTVRQAIDSNPIWFAEVAKDYFHIPDTQNSDWFENGEGGRVLSLKGKDKFELALLSTHLPNAESVGKIVNTAPAGALGKAIGTVTALKAFPDRDLSGKITEAVEAIIETQRFRKYSPTGEPGDKPGVAWNKAYAIQNLAGIGEETPPEPDIVTRAIYQALLDRKTTRLNAALKDLIAGQSAGMDFLLAPEVEGKKLETPAELFNSAFEPELKEIAHQEGKKGDFGITQEEFDAALQGRDVPDEERAEEKKPEEIRAGKVGDMLAAGEVVSTTTGRKTTPFPKLDTDSNRKAQNTFKRVDQWLMENAVEEARARGDEFNLRQFEQNKSKPSQADKDSAEMYLFDKESIQPIPKPILKSFGPPPKAATPEVTATRKLGTEKAEQGYVTPAQLKSFLDTNPATKDHASELMRTAQMMAEHVYEADPPIGVDKKDALDWILRERVGRIEAGERKGVRGEYVDPRLEKGLANGILRLHKAADATSFIHEFAHVIFPMLSDEDLKAIDTIGEKKVWDGSSVNLKGETYVALSEKLANGMERFLRDQNPRDFSAEVGKVLARVKEIFRKIYMQFRRDPLTPYTLGSDSVELFDKMFHIEGSDVPDEWREELKKARAAEKKIVRPEEQPHPVVQLARELGGTGLKESVDGKPVYMFGDRVDPRKPTAVISFSSEEPADLAVSRLAEGKDKIDGGELIKANDGTWAVKINTPGKLPKGSLFQELPEKHPALQLDDLEKRLKDTPAFKTFERRLVQNQIDRLKARIRTEAGLTEPEPQRDPELPTKVLQEVSNAKTADRGRVANDDVNGVPKPPRVGGIPQPPKLGVSGHGAAKRGGAAARGSVPRAPVSLENVKPVSLEPLSGVRGEPVGTVKGEPFDQKAWVEGLKRAGLPESTPAPTYALDPKTAAQLIYPGQKQIVQTVMSALEEGDGAAIITPPGSGKSYHSTAIIKEFLRDHPDGSVLYISKNRSLLKKTKRVGANTFGFDMELDTPEGQPGVYGASYMGLLNNEIYKNSKWDLVVADESGEARRWYDEETKQGQMLRDVMANSRKGVYLSATPFHSPMEYGYLDKLNLWPKGQFDKWIQENFAHEKVGDKIVARLDPARQAKLREQLIERGQFVSQAISYEGYNAHFGVVPVTDSMKRGLDRIREGFDRARDQFVRMGKQGLAKKTAAFEAVYTKNFLERERLPQAIDLAKQARSQGWRVLFFSEHTADDLFRRERAEGEDASTYQQLDDAMGGQLSRIIPPYPSIFNELYAEFGAQVGDYSGRGNTDAAREKARTDFLKGDVPMLYASYAGGGIGVDMHDADYPELNVKGGDKPIVAIYLGPPYSGVLLEQAMGRPWRFGVKSDVHAVFLVTDSEPDIRLMQTKVGPRMKALRAAVLGEKDSLANVMSTYTDDEKVRERQDQLAYAEGNEQKVSATQFQVRSKQRNVGIQDWSAITFPSAEEAKQKGMRYGEAVTGGDWSSLYQSKFEFRPPDSPQNAVAKTEIDLIGNSATTDPPPSLQNLEPADRNAVVGGASAMASDGVELPVERDKEGVARQTMEWALHIPKGMRLTYEREMTRFGLRKARAVWKFPEGGKPYNRPVGPFGDEELEDHPTRYIGWGSMKGGIESMTRQAGVPQIGLQLTDMIGSAQRDQDMFKSQYRYYAIHAFEDNGLKRDEETVAQVRDVVEGKRSSANPAINKAASEMHDLNEWAAEEVQKAGVKRHASGGNWEPWVPRKNYFTHVIDWDADIEYQNPHTGETERHSLKDVMKRTFAEEKRRKILERLASRARNSDGTAVSPEALNNWLRQHYRRNAPIQPNIQEQRTIEFPILKNDWGVIDNYADQLGKAIGIARNFGSDRGKIDPLIAKIPSADARRDITTIFDSILSPQQISGRWRKFTSAVTAFTALTKMPLSFAKVPFHSAHMIYALHGDVRPMVKAAARMMTDFKNVYDENVYMGTLARQTDFTGAIEGWQSSGPQHWMFDVTGFNAMYNVSRVFASEAARVEMEQYVMRDLLSGGKRADEARRILNHTMLIGDGAIDEAIANRRFSDEDIRRAQVAFSNEVMFTDNPTEMPKWAREPVTKETSGSVANVSRALRLSYSMASFTVKTRMFLRKQIWDETFRYHNPKMLALFAVMEPIIGAGVATIGSGLRSGIQRSVEAATGQPKKPDALDTEKSLFENAWKGGWGKKGLAEKAELYIDLLTWGTAQEQVRLVGDMLFNIAANPKKSITEAKFFGPDILEGVVGPIWNSTVVRPLGWALDEAAIWARGGPKEGKRAWAALWKEIFGETSITSNIPQVKKLEAPPR